MPINLPKNQMGIRALLFLMLTLSTLSCSRRSRQFSLLTHNRTGITFRNAIEETEQFNHLAYSYLYNGAGVAAGDINNDGLVDLYFTGNLVPSRLYLNQGDFRFEDITDSAGVSARETWNNGAAMADVNGDGFLDIYVCSSTDGRPKYRKNLLFINNGDLTFTEKAGEYGLEVPAYSTHSAFFDYDKDGDLDLFVINHSVDKYARFTEHSPELKHEYSPSYGHRLFRNDGDQFTDVTDTAGILSNVLNFGLGLAVSDFNNDHWPDIYICNDFYEQDYFYINRQDGTFSEQLEPYFSHITFSSMGNDAADINNDGNIDLFTLDMLPEANLEQKLVAGPHNYEKYKLLETWGFYHQTTRNMLQLNEAGQYFTEIGQYAGIDATNWSWSPLLCDFDNNGLKDLFISNGYGKNNTHMDVLEMLVEDVKNKRKGEKGMTEMELIDRVPATILKNYMFRNNGDLTFTNVRKQWGFDRPSLSNGAAYADLDNDGDMDLVISNINEYAFVYRNNAEKISGNHFLKIRLKGSGLNTGGIGARIDVTCGVQTFTQECYPSRGYMSSMDPALVFGLGKATTVDEIRILWPDLREQTLRDLEVDQTITLDNEQAIMEKPEIKPEFHPLFQSIDHHKPLHFRHTENHYVDFNDQPLLPWLLSTQGPRMATGDVNGDGLNDVFIGGARSFPGALYIQLDDGTFEARRMECFETDRGSEDLGVLFVDVDQDADPDLYVVSGGNEFTVASEELQDRLYINDGHGNFSRSADRLPAMLSSGSCVIPADIDHDGDTDLFIGGRLTPGLYPIAPRSYVLENDGRGYFRDVTEEKNPDLLKPGMVTDALWTDFSGDGLPDLILVGEWMPVRLFRNTGPALEEITGQPWMRNSRGWWNCVCSGDFDRDGDADYMLGNLGLNFRIKPSPDEPASIHAADFDNNGSLDAVMSYYINGKSYPMYSKFDLEEQIPSIKRQYPDHASYADQTISDIFPESILDHSLLLTVNDAGSAYLANLGNNQFKLSGLPLPAQLSPIFSMRPDDYNGDGYLDVLLAGNFDGFRIPFGRQDANKGLLLLGDGKGNFAAMPNQKSGLFINGEVRDVARVRQASGQDLVLFALNNDSLRLYRLTNH
jgi:hypothetical protein